jgi:hypothetical protein
MHSQSRTILILMLLAIGGVSALAFIAYRYTRVLDEGVVSDEESVRQVDAFIRVRQGMMREVGSWEDGAFSREALAVVRDRALALHDVDPQKYAEIRTLYRAWRDGRLRAGTPVASAFERRREKLREIDLGVHEPLDS